MPPRHTSRAAPGPRPQRDTVIAQSQRSAGGLTGLCRPWRSRSGSARSRGRAGSGCSASRGPEAGGHPDRGLLPAPRGLPGHAAAVAPGHLAARRPGHRARRSRRCCMAEIVVVGSHAPAVFCRVHTHPRPADRHGRRAASPRRTAAGLEPGGRRRAARRLGRLRRRLSARRPGDEREAMLAEAGVDTSGLLRDPDGVWVSILTATACP